MTKIIVSNSYSKMDGDFSPTDMIDVLSKVQRFYIRNKFNKKGEWKSRDISLFNRKFSTFPTGFLPDVYRLYPNAELIDNRKLLPPVIIPKTSIKLRWYQEEALKAILKYFRGVIWHPTGCVDCDTEFLTSTGWKKISKYSINERVAQYTQDETIQFVIPNNYIKLPCDKFYQFETKYGIDQCFSREHNIVYKTKAGYIKKISLAQMIEKHNRTVSGFHGNFITTFNVKENGGIPYSDIEIRLMVACIADGHFPKKSKLCKMRLKKERKKKRIRMLLKMSLIDYDEKTPKYEAKGFSQFIFKPLLKIKEFNELFWYCSPDQLQIISDEVLLWDGDCKQTFTTTSKKSADFIQYVFSACGYRTSIYKDKRIKKYKNGECYNVRKSNKATTTIIRANPNNKVKINEYQSIDGYKYCFNVPSGMLLLRRSNKIFVTGNSGKTHLAMKMIEILQSSTLYVVPNLELLHEIYKKFLDHFPKEYIGIVGDGEWNPSTITIATNQTLWTRFEEPQVQKLLKNVNLLISDESHRINEAQYFNIANTYYKVVMSCDAFYRIGLSATPGNKDSLTRFFLKGAIGNVIHYQGSKELIEQGLLSQPYVRFIRNEITFPTWKRNEWALAKKNGIMMNNQRNFKISELADHHHKQGDTVLIIVDRIDKHGSLLCDTIPHSRFLHGKTNKKIRKEIRSDFREDKIPILISTLFTEGVDYPNIDVVILALGGKTENGFYQKIGRSMRIAEGKDKCIIYDFIDEDNSILQRHSYLRYDFAQKEDGYISDILTIEDWRKENT
jgi:superfamily II DNA or RNA helicase